MRLKYRVYCPFHKYDTLLTMDSEGGAIMAAQMHALLPCYSVKVVDSTGKDINWGDEERDAAKRRVHLRNYGGDDAEKNPRS